LRPIQRWHGLQEFVQREAGRQMIDEHLYRNPGSPKAGRPGQPVRVDPDDFLQSPKDFQSHSSTEISPLPQTVCRPTPTQIRHKFP
jgi:hypothetical protein